MLCARFAHALTQRITRMSTNGARKVTADGAAKPKAQMGLGAFLVKGVKMSESKTLAAAAAPPPARSVATEAKATENDAAGANGAADDAKATKTTSRGRKTSKPAAFEAAPAKRAKKAAGPGPDRSHEKKHWEAGRHRVVGVDEAGRGPLAGPVVAAACYVPKDCVVDCVNDSKQLTEEGREEIFEELMANKDIEYGVCIIDQDRIDEINILECTMEAMTKSAADVPNVDWVLIDGNRVPKPLEGKAEAIVKGDAKNVAIAAASIIAKVTRDRMMLEIDKEFPMYGFKDHKGYGTKAHMAAIDKYGPCIYHRKTFAPIKHMDLSKWPDCMKKKE
jgi:ribonuclease HII